MIGNTHTYFTPQNCTRPYFLFNGMVHDTLCTELLTLSEIRKELHRHLRANGFDAVFFCDPKQILTMYDMQSSYVLNYRALPTAEQRRRFTTDRNLQRIETQAQPREHTQQDGRVFFEDDVIEEAPERTDPNGNDAGAAIYVPLHTTARDLDTVILANLHSVMTSEKLRCALVFYHLEQWKTGMNESMLNLLSELDRMREYRRSIAIFLAPSLPGQDMERLLLDGAGGNHWRNFALQYLLPGLRGREDMSEADFRLITIVPPGKGEIRNYLTMKRLTPANPLSIQMEELDDICRDLAAKCSEKHLPLRDLDHRLTDWQLEHRGAVFSLASVNELLGGGRYRTALQELDDLVGMEPLKAYFRQKADLVKMSWQNGQEREDLNRLTPRNTVKRTSGFGMNLLLLGDPGTGKSKAIELIGKLFREIGLLPDGGVHNLSVTQLLDHNFDLEAEFRRALGGVIAIDEAYGLLDHYNGRQILNTLTDCMSRYAGQLSVILAGYKDRLLSLLSGNPGLNSRFPASGRIELPPYHADELRQIFLKMAEGRQQPQVRITESLNQVLPVFFENFTQPTHKDWGNAREAANLLETMVSLCSTRYSKQQRSSESELELTVEDIPEKLRPLTTPRAQDLNQALRDMQKLTGMHNVKQHLMRIVHEISLHGASEPGAYLFLGPPGTGKTMMCEKFSRLLYLLHVIQNPVPVKYTALELLQPPKDQERPGDVGLHLGSGLRAAVEKARGRVLFIDEAHQLASRDATNGIQSGSGVLKELVPIMEDPEFRASTCLILAGYTGPMEQMLTVDQGFASRFPPSNRIRFTNYTAEELVEIMQIFAKEDGEILEPEFNARSTTALSKYLTKVDFKFGNARWIRKEYLPFAQAKRDRRLLAPFNLKTYEALSAEQLASIPEADRHRLTGADIPDIYNLSLLAGPLGVAPPPALTPDAMLEELFEKEALINFARMQAAARTQSRFLDEAQSTGINFTLAGPTGSGRHMAVRAVAELFARSGLIDSKEVQFYDRGKLVAGYIGQTAGQTRSAVSNSQGGVAVIVNPSSLVNQNRSGSTNDFGPEAVQELANCIADYGNNTCFVLLDTKAGLEQFFKAAPYYRRLFQNQFEFEDLSIDAMQRIFDLKTRDNYVFEDSIAPIMKRDFIANWVADRGGLGSNFQNWNNGAEIESLLNKLRGEWEERERKQRQNGNADPAQPSGEKAEGEGNSPAETVTAESGYTARLITRDMFPRQLQKYLKKTSLEEQAALDRLESMVGWTRVKYGINLIRKKLETADSPEEVVPGNYLFIGNPGTGKTEAAKLMGSVLRAAHALKQGYVIMRTAAEMREQLNEFDAILAMARNNVLFIDEAHQLGDPHYPGGAEVMKRLLTVLEDMEVKKNTCIILAGYPREMNHLLQVDPGLKSRFDLEESIVYFDDYTPDELMRIMESMAAQADQMREIGARAPLDLEHSPEFVSRAERVFRAVVARNDPNYGNARFVRNFLHNAVNKQILRLYEKYGKGNPIPREEYRLLTADDIPDRERAEIAGEERGESAMIPASALLSTAEGTSAISYSMLPGIVETVGHSVMLLEKREKNQITGHGTGFVITKDGHMLTCAHVVRGADQIRARMYWPGMPGGSVRWFECKILRPVREDLDMAVIQIQDGGDFVPLNLRAADQTVSDTEDVTVIGYPFGTKPNPDLSKLVHNHFEGRISSVQNRGEDTERCFIDCSGKAGNSGSPVISLEDGRVVGVFDGSITEGERLVEEINYFTSIRLFWKYFVLNGGTENG